MTIWDNLVTLQVDQVPRMGAQLTWKEHMDAKVRKVCNMMWACRRACGGRWGLRPRVVYSLYASVVRPSITYASLVWWLGCETARAKQQLSIIQWLACLGITGAMSTTLTNVVEALVSLPRWILWYRVRLGPRRTTSGVWDAGLTCIPIVVIAVYWCGFSNRTPYLI
jgi:hypothetical protein